MVKWVVYIKGERHIVMIKHSVISGKKAVWLDNVLQNETKKLLSSDYTYTWSALDHTFCVVADRDDEGLNYCE